MHKVLLSIVLIIGLTGCDRSSSSHSSVAIAAPEPAILLVANDAGDAKLGAVYQFDLNNLTQKKQLYQAQGGHEPYDNELEYHSGMVYSNPESCGDGKFWGVSGSHYVGAGKLFSFDPETDRLVYEYTLAKEYRNSEYFAAGWHSTPVLTPDCKGLLVVAQSGGRDAFGNKRYNSGGEGVLVFINIDKNDTEFGAMNIVYEFYSGGSTNTGVLAEGQIRNVLANPSLGKHEGGDALFLLSDGMLWNIGNGYQHVPGYAFTLSPTDVDDWSQPWEISWWKTLIAGQFSLHSTSSEVIYDDVHQRFIYSVFDHQNGETFVASTDSTYMPEIINLNSDECFYNAGMVRLAGKNYLMCRGYDRKKTSSYTNNNPRLLEVNSGRPASSVMTFAEWKNLNGSDYLNIAPFDLTVDADNGKVLITAGTFHGREYLGNNSLSQFKDAFFYPSRVEEISPGNTFVRNILFQGSIENGEHFVGKPVIGGELGQYIVQYSITGDESIPGYILKYDRAQNRVTARIPLGAKSPAYPTSKPLKVGERILIGGLDSNEQGLSGVVSFSGALSDYHINIPPVLNYSPWNASVYAGAPLNFEVLDNGQIWALTKSSNQAYMSYFINLNSAAEVTNLSYLSDPVSTARDGPGNRVDGVLTTFTLESKNNILVYPDWYESDEIDGERNRLVCTPAPGAPGVVRASMLADGERAVRGMTLHRDDKLYVATTGSQQRLLEVDIGNCTEDPELIERVADLSGLNSTVTTRLLSASDGLLYFGTEDGFLASFNPADNTVLKQKDLADADIATTSRVIGYLSEPRDGVIMGIVADVSGVPKSRRLFKYDINTNMVTFEDISSLLEDDEIYPGVVRYQ